MTNISDTKKKKIWSLFHGRCGTVEEIAAHRKVNLPIDVVKRIIGNKHLEARITETLPQQFPDHYYPPPINTTPRTRHTPEQLAAGWKADLLNDAKHAEEQVASGEFYPERGITRESLLAYAAECRQQAEQPIPAQFARSLF